jgi:hypothetical protein
MKRLFFILCLPLFFIICSIEAGYAQVSATIDVDSLKTEPSEQLVVQPLEDTAARAAISDTLKIRRREVIPKKSGLYSAILPGLGQLNNGQYWKIGVVYAALGVGTGFIIYNNNEYKYWKKIYVGRLSQDADAMKQEAYLSDNQVKMQQDFYRKNMDMSMLITGLGYALQIIDAIVFAHLRDFDISPDISMKIKPVQMPQAGAGIGLVFNF